MEIIHTLFDFILHIDKHLAEIISQYGTLTYLILFLIIFGETGFVITPFLPGDSLLFAAGALCANEATGMNIWLLCILLIIAAISGNIINYQVGRWIGPKAFETDKWFLKKKNLDRTQEFFEKYGMQAIVFSRFMPIIRTFAPFVAGVGKMNYKKFSLFNVLGGFLWVVLFLFAGYLFGNVPAVKNNFTIVILAIIFVSLIPVFIALLKGRKGRV